MRARCMRSRLPAAGRPPRRAFGSPNLAPVALQTRRSILGKDRRVAVGDLARTDAGGQQPSSVNDVRP